MGFGFSLKFVNCIRRPSYLIFREVGAAMPRFVCLSNDLVFQLSLHCNGFRGSSGGVRSVACSSFFFGMLIVRLLLLLAYVPLVSCIFMLAGITPHPAQIKKEKKGRNVDCLYWLRFHPRWSCRFCCLSLSNVFMISQSSFSWKVIQNSH